MSNVAMSYMADDLEKMDGYNPKGLFQIGDGKNIDGKRSAVSQMQNEHAVTSMSKNGAFSQLIAHGTISAVYSLWEEEFRAQIASELDVNADDVMGDIRLLRHFIVHNKTKADNRITKLKEINWVKEGHLIFTEADMSCLQKLINEMQVYVREKTPNK
jgi:hypothetical protein